MSQLSYNLNHPESMLGMKADAVYDLVEGTWIASQEVIPIGRICAKVVGEDNGCQLPDASNQELIGGALHTFQLIADPTTGLVQYAVNDPVNVLRMGRIWVWSEEAVDPDTDSVYVRTVAGGAGELRGQVRTDVAGGNAIAFPKAKFRKTITAAGLMLLEIDAKP